MSLHALEQSIQRKMVVCELEELAFTIFVKICVLVPLRGNRDNWRNVLELN